MSSPMSWPLGPSAPRCTAWRSAATAGMWTFRAPAPSSRWRPIACPSTRSWWWSAIGCSNGRLPGRLGLGGIPGSHGRDLGGTPAHDRRVPLAAAAAGPGRGRRDGLLLGRHRPLQRAGRHGADQGAFPAGRGLGRTLCGRSGVYRPVSGPGTTGILKGVLGPIKKGYPGLWRSS